MRMLLEQFLRILRYVIYIIINKEDSDLPSLPSCNDVCQKEIYTCYPGVPVGREQKMAV